MIDARWLNYINNAHTYHPQLASSSSLMYAAEYKYSVIVAQQHHHHLC
jgi:hypothetical protein